MSSTETIISPTRRRGRPLGGLMNPAIREAAVEHAWNTTIAAAARKFQVDPSTISRWMREA